MAKRKNCKTVTVCGKRRTLCFRPDGKIASNTAAGAQRSRGASKKKSSTKKSGGFKFVSKEKALTAKGRLKPGCKFTKNGRAMCRS